MKKSIRKTSECGMVNLTISFGDGYVKSNNEATLYIIFYLLKKKIKINTGVSVHEDDWDPVNKRVRSRNIKAGDYNLIITDTISRINDIFIRYRLSGKTLSADLLKKELKNPSTHLDVFGFMTMAIEERRGELTETSVSQHYATMNKLKEFRKNLTFSEIDTDFIKKFNRWLINEKKNSQNTRHNVFKTLKAYWNIAIEKKLITSNPFQRIPVSRTTGDRIWLTEEELQDLISLYNRQFLPATYQKVLRHFLFSCFTGLRISDVVQITMDNIIGNHIVLIPHKTKNQKPITLRIPLCSFAKRLIQDESPFRIHGKIFDMLSEPQTRLHLKEAVKVAKIKKNVTFHSGRHTFATLFLKKTKNILALQRLLGHSRIEMTMIYAHILTEEIDAEVNNAFGNY